MKRTKAGKTSFEGKYQKVYNLLANDAKLRSKIKQTAAQYGIDPMHIVGAIVGEHTYNVDAYDRLQTYYVKAAAYLSNSLTFQYEGEDVVGLRAAAAIRKPATASTTAMTCGRAARRFGTRISVARRLTVGYFQRIGSARYSSNRSMPARPSVLDS